MQMPEKLPIGITFALHSESSDFIRQLRQVENGDNLLWGKIGDRDVTIVHTGVGANNCNERLEILLHKARPEFVITSGFAGAVSEELSVGDLIVAENFSDPNLLRLAKEILRRRKARTVKLFTSTSVVDSISERNEIARNSGAAAVDMETGAIVAVCNAHGIPLLSLRGISDSPQEPLPAPPPVLFDIERQRTSFGPLFSCILRDPASIGRLYRFTQQIRRVRSTLTEAIVTLVKEL
jgi:adenosylhomocysteine nucleosidase